LRYECWRDARERMSADERRGFYAHTFGVPSGDAGDVEPNREFTALWLRFLATVSEFERQQAAGDAVISKQDVQIRARELAANISRHGAYAAAAAIAIEDQRKVLVDLLSDPDLQQAYGVRGVWRLIERVSELEFGGSRSSARYGTMAENGAVVFAWLTNLGEHDADADLAQACEQWLAVAAVADEAVDEFARPIDDREMRAAVRALFVTSAAFEALSPVLQARVVRDMARVTDYLSTVGSTAQQSTAFLAAVDFPAFVAELINGVFEAIVDVSIRQMEAYADLVAAVAASVDQFRAATISDRQLLANLCEIDPLLCAPLDEPATRRALDSLAGGAWCRLASSRQQLLATMVLMGIQRVRRNQ
jgi:hypothetical protein